MKQDQDTLLDFEQGFSIEDAQFNILPQQVPSNLTGQKQELFKLPNEVQNLPEKWQSIAKDLQKEIQQILLVWDVSKNNKTCSFEFQLPPSYFKKKMTIFEKLNENQLIEYNEVQKLTPEQLEQIQQSGTFDMPSKKFPIPYVWQLSSFIIKGVKHIEQTYNKTLSLAFAIYYRIPKIIKSENDHLNGFYLTIRSGFNNILTKPLVFIGMIIGLREMTEECNKSMIYNELEYQRQMRLKQLNVQNILYDCFKFQDKKEENYAKKIKSQMHQFAETFNDKAKILKVYMQNLAELTEMKIENKRLTVEDSERIELISNLTQEIDNLSAEIEDFYKVDIDVNMSIEKQIQNHIMKCQEIYWQKSKYEPQLLQQLISLTTCMQTLDYYTSIRDNELQKQIEIFKDNLKVKHPIKSLCASYINDEVNKFKKEVKKTLNLELRQSIIKELKELNVKEVEIYLDYYQHSKETKEIIKQKMQNREHIIINPKRVIYCKRFCFPPYQIIHENDMYRLQRVIYYNLDTSFIGWRLYLMGLTWYTWTMNVMFWLFVNAISAKFGLRALFSVRAFHPDVTIDQHTGEVSPGNYSVTPVFQLFQQVIQGMKKSRQRFEMQPDTGFFGKNIQRFWNYLEVYIFRFLFVGILIVCILMPIGILINSILSLILAITAGAWIPFVILLSLLTKIFIYDWDVSYPRKNLLEHQKIFPFFCTIYSFLINGKFQLILSLLMIIIISPLCILSISLYAIIQKYSRLYYDKFMIRIVKLLGRVPATENNLAWKIAGPRISRRHFYGVSLDQAIVLIAAELENVILRKYKQQMVEQIQAPSKHIQDSLQRFFQLFQANIYFNDKGVNILIDQLKWQLTQQYQLQPKLEVQVRFTEEELVVLLKEAKKFIKKQMLLKNMGQYIWDRYQIRKGDYNSLVETIVKAVFGDTILEPLEDIDMRFTLQEEDTHDISQKISRALEGQVNLEIPKRFHIQQINSNQITVQKRFRNFSHVIDLAFHYQRLNQDWSSINDKISRFYKNVCLK